MTKTIDDLLDYWKGRATRERKIPKKNKLEKRSISDIKDALSGADTSDTTTSTWWTTKIEVDYAEYVEKPSREEVVPKPKKHEGHSRFIGTSSIRGKSSRGKHSGHSHRRRGKR